MGPCNHKGFHKTGRESEWREGGMMMEEAEVGERRLLEGGHEPRNAGSLSKLDKASKEILSLRLLKEPALLISPVWMTLDF